MMVRERLMGGAHALGAFASINGFSADGTRQTLVIDRSEARTSC
jgi:hypothetical protein